MGWTSEEDGGLKIEEWQLFSHLGSRTRRRKMEECGKGKAINSNKNDFDLLFPFFPFPFFLITRQVASPE
jgi:hypothetical protein